MNGSCVCKRKATHTMRHASLSPCSSSASLEKRLKSTHGGPATWTSACPARHLQPGWTRQGADRLT
eukprot:2925695-Alexandrium_andersonii.AAC.1